MESCHHRQPYPGDNGITFEPADDCPETLAEIARVKMRFSTQAATPGRLFRRIPHWHPIHGYADNPPGPRRRPRVRFSPSQRDFPGVGYTRITFSRG